MARRQRIKRFFDIRSFALPRIKTILNAINIQVVLQHDNPFPKDNGRLLSFYQYKRRKMRFRKGRPKGNVIAVIFTLVDFSFIRSLTAQFYSLEGGPCYDPVTLILLELLMHIRRLPSRKELLDNLTDTERSWVGLAKGQTPVEADFTNLRRRLGDEVYNAILHVLVEMVCSIGLITGRILAIDGLLFSSWSHYKGCQYANEKCCQFGCRKVPTDLEASLALKQVQGLLKES